MSLQGNTHCTPVKQERGFVCTENMNNSTSACEVEVKNNSAHSRVLGVLRTVQKIGEFVQEEFASW